MPFPGSRAGYDAKYTETSTRTLARFAVYASTRRPEVCGGGKTFNVADAERPGTMRERWPQIAGWFGCECDDSSRAVVSRATPDPVYLRSPQLFYVTAFCH